MKNGFFVGGEMEDNFVRIEQREEEMPLPLFPIAVVIFTGIIYTLYTFWVFLNV